MNWTCKVTYQNRNLNRKPSEKNTHTVTVNFSGMTKEEVLKKLEIGYCDGYQKVVDHTELIPC